MFTAIYLRILFNILFDCNPFGRAYSEYFMYMIYYAIVVILIDLYSQK